MKTQKFKNCFLLAILLLTSSVTTAQQFPVGGYQGSGHGNITAKTWSGAVDEKWHVADNWCPTGVPGAQDDVIIPAAAPMMPEVKVQGLSCNNVTIRQGAALTIIPGIVLTINGLMKIEGP